MPLALLLQINTRWILVFVGVLLLILLASTGWFLSTSTSLSADRSIAIVNQHPRYQISLFPLRRSDNILRGFEPVLDSEGIGEIEIVITDQPQYINYSWETDAGSTPYSGFKPVKEGAILRIFIFLNRELLDQAGWTERTIAQEIEVNVFRALTLIKYKYSRVPTEQISTEGLDHWHSVHSSNTLPNFMIKKI